MLRTLETQMSEGFGSKNERFCIDFDRFGSTFRSFWHLPGIPTSIETPPKAARAPKATPGPKMYGFDVIFGQKGVPLGGSLGSFWRLFSLLGVPGALKTAFRRAFKIKTDFASILGSPRRGSGGFSLERQLDSHIFSRTPKSSILASILELF